MNIPENAKQKLLWRLLWILWPRPICKEFVLQLWSLLEILCFWVINSMPLVSHVAGSASAPTGQFLKLFAGLLVTGLRFAASIIYFPEAERKYYVQWPRSDEYSSANWKLVSYPSMKSPPLSRSDAWWGRRQTMMTCERLGKQSSWLI